MENKKFDIFNFFRSCVQFFKIVVMFFLMLHLLYWVQYLLNATWNWMNFARPVLDWYINMSAKISDGSAEILGTVFEYKYIVATVLYIATYFIVNILNFVINEAEYHTKNINMSIKKHNENTFNKSLLKEQTVQETKINRYKILVKTSIKKQFSHADFGYNLEDQNRIMNKFLIEKTGVQPDVFDGGFLYSFSNFNKIDKILEIFFRVLKSEAPLNYIICVQILENNDAICLSKLKQIADLNMINKITMLSETSYRYGFNETTLYRTTQLGMYQHESGSIELCEFVE